MKGSMIVANLDHAMVPTPDAVLQQVAVAAAVVQLGALKDATRAVKVTVATNAIRVTFDGTAPVGGTTGHYYAANANDTWSRAMAIAAKMIQDGVGAGEISATELAIG